MAQNPITKSIDVGSMFLMDMSVCESESACDLADAVPIDSNSTTSGIAPRNNYRKTRMSAEHHRATEIKPTYSLQTSIAGGQANATLSSSIDMIASVINSDCHQGGSNAYPEHQIAAADSQPIDNCHEPQSYSLSDESYVASSGTSLSASYTVGSEPGNEDRDSTTTREDSGVLDMKDLEGQLINSYDNECDEKFHLHNQRFGQEKPISSNIIATNLINKSVTSNNQQQQNNYISEHSHRLGKPTEGNGNDHNHHSSHSKRSISASVPIQVPVRQMRKDLNKLKLKLMKEELKFEQQAHLINHRDDTEQQDITSSLVKQNETSPRTLAWDDDDDAFLDQEYNENHHNHYPLNYDDEHPRAGDDPMKLFASIQALAKSLHEDAELFGSLPPKRLLESPIRSIALV